MLRRWLIWHNRLDNTEGQVTHRHNWGNNERFFESIYNSFRFSCSHVFQSCASSGNGAKKSSESVIRIWTGQRRYDWQLSRYLINRLFDRKQLGGNGPFNPFVIRDLEAKGDRASEHLFDRLVNAETMRWRGTSREIVECRACNLNLINFLAVAEVN